MENQNDHKSRNSYAAKDGLRLCVLLAVAFFCTMGNFVHPLWGLVSMALHIYIPFFVGRCVIKYRNNVLDGFISFRQAFGYSFLTFIYGFILLAFVQFIYFQFFDHGFFINEYVKLFSDPEVKEMLQQYGISTNDRKQIIDMLTSLRPIDIAIQYLMMNMVIGGVLSIIIALVTKRKKY